MPFLKKVVVVEDEDAVAHLVQASLGDAGYLCLRARDGEEALRLAEREAPDLIILDILMPKLDGMEVVRRLKNDPVQSRIPVLMLTALGSVDDRVRGLGAGADDYMPKPFDMRELLARCQSLVRHNRRERDRSPTTDLPGPGTLDSTITDWLADGEAFGLLFIEIGNFEKFVAENGWLRGTEVVADVAKGLRATVDETPGATLVHLGADDFAVLSSAATMAPLADALRRTGTHRVTEFGPPAMTLELSVVDVSGAKTSDEVARAVARARAKWSKRPARS
jgi:DNA-binding response OmpR family regulator